MPHSFNIEVKIGYKIKRIKVDYIPVDDRIEHFKLYGNKVIIIESNRPLFRNKGIKRRKPDYKLISGTISHQSKLDPFIEELDRFFESNVPVRFESNEVILHGMLTRVSGAGHDGMYFLQVDNFHWGQLSPGDSGWQWNSNTNPELSKHINYFVKRIQMQF